MNPRGGLACVIQYSPRHYALSQQVQALAIPLTRCELGCFVSHMHGGRDARQAGALNVRRIPLLNSGQEGR